MTVESITGRNISKNTAINMAKILNNKLFKYKNVAANVVLNSSTHAYIRMSDMLCDETSDNRTICTINIFDHGYTITGSKSIGTVYIRISDNGIIPPIVTIHKWLRKIIKAHRNG